jgi:hypothetical protein
MVARALEVEGFGTLAADLLRAGLAVPAHVAAGSTAGSRLEHQRAVAAALAAVARFETVLAATERLAPGAGAACATLLAGTADVTRSLRAFARAIGASPASTTRTAGPPADGDGEPAAPTPSVSTAPAASAAPSPPPGIADTVPPAPPMLSMPSRPARTRRPRGAARTGA